MSDDDQVRLPGSEPGPQPDAEPQAEPGTEPGAEPGAEFGAELGAEREANADMAAHAAGHNSTPLRQSAPAASHLLMDVELEATLRFGSREMTLGEVLDLGPGDVIELDRQVDDTVELLVGDKIVARGVAVLSRGRYGLRVTEVAELRLGLESVRCLF